MNRSSQKTTGSPVASASHAPNARASAAFCALAAVEVDRQADHEPADLLLLDQLAEVARRPARGSRRV